MKVAAVWNRAWVPVVPLAVIPLLPGLARACAVCFSGRSDETREAFIATTAFMTFLPILLIGGVVWWFRRRVLAMRAEERAIAARLVQVD
ncbi:MAG: hypothetical protein AAEJ52_11355 [Myxococcota bacterium]